ncbi:kinase-like domain-containing protein [Chaetomium tenue]|uniref:Kinase-like domain-containing protein n=1 Tax=Chaetomium tenue TaxID=1854479 RepID=A0ACB7NVV1_9PEZI|nr:kinase-like domain-containing protein [Chaetomium globosum]
MASQTTLPYFAPQSVLPAKLPTIEEILKGKKIPSAHYVVARVGEHFVVKYGENVQLQEGENMLFVRQCTSVPLPTVYALYHDEKTNWNFIVMEYIPGRSLSSAWKDMTASEKATVALQLRRNMDELRKVPSPGYYGGIWRQGILDSTFTDPDSGAPLGDETITGPHETEEQWNDAMWSCVNALMRSREREKLPVYRMLYKNMFKGHEPVFTHADFCPANIILRDDNKGVVMIDWQYSGWYPTYWEYGLAMTQLDHSEDWWEYLQSILTPYFAELGWMKIHRESMLFQ